MLPLLRRYDLVARPYRLRSSAANVMAITTNVRKCVLFIGHGDEEHFVASGTGFLLVHDGCRYLVTARHVVHTFQDDPFSIRINKLGGDSDTLTCDLLEGGNKPWFKWHFPSDPTVDLAVIPFMYDLAAAGFDVAHVRFDDFASQRPGIGIGDVCHAIGLFRLVQGRSRNTPVVHTGHLALLAGEEPIPVQGWDGSRSVVQIDAHLVQLANLDGLSGAPVFIRGEVDLTGLPTNEGITTVSLTESRLWLLGVWQGSWEKQISRGLGSLPERHPAGIGVVTPADALLKLLEQDDVADSRQQFFAERRFRQAATPDNAPMESGERPAS